MYIDSLKIINLNQNKLYLFSNLFLCIAWIFQIAILYNFITIPIPFISLIISMILIILLPGFLLSRILQVDSRLVPEKLALSFGLGVGALSLVAVILISLRQNLAVMALATMSLTFCLLILDAILSYRRKSREMKTEDIDVSHCHANNPTENFIYWLAFLAIISFVMMFVVNKHAPFYSWLDRTMYQAFILHFIDANHFFDVGFRVSEDIILRSSREMFQVWLLIIALAIKSSHVTLIDAYVYYIPLFLIPFSFSALYALSRELLNKHLSAVIVCLLQVSYYFTDVGSHETIGQGYFFRLIEDKFLIRFIVLPIGLWLTIRYFKTAHRGTAIALVLLIFALGCIHPLGSFFYGICLGLIYLAFQIYNSWEIQRKSLLYILPILLPLIITTLIPFWQRQQMAVDNIDTPEWAIAADDTFNLESGLEENKTRGNRLNIISKTDNIYTASYGLLEHKFLFLAIILAPLLLFYFHKDVSARILLMVVMGTLILCYIPFFASLIGRLISPWQLWRVLWILPASLVLGYWVTKILEWLEICLPKALHQAANYSPLALAIIITIFFQQNIAEGHAALDDRGTRILEEQEFALFEYLRDQGLHGSCIIMYRFNNEIPGMVGHSYGTTFRRVPPPLDSIESIIQKRSNFFNAEVITQEHVDFIQEYEDRYKSIYIVVETHTPIYIQFRELATIFTPVYANQRYAVYQWSPNNITQTDQKLIEGNTLLSSDKNLTLAATLFQSIQKNDQDNGLALLGLSIIEKLHGKSDSSANHLDEAIDLLSPNIWLDVQSMNIQFAKHENGRLPEIAELIQSYKDILANNHQNVLIIRHIFRDVYLDSSSQFKNSIYGEQLINAILESYTNRMNSQPNNFSKRNELASVYADLGNLYAKQKHTQKAINSYKKSIHLWPNTRRAYRGLANMYLRQDRIDQANTLYESTIQQNPNWVWPRIDLGQLQLRISEINSK